MPTGVLTSQILVVLGIWGATQWTAAALGSQSIRLGVMGVVKRSRHWCPTCYRKWRDSDEEVYDKLIWQFTNLEMCPEDGTELAGKCFKCQKYQPIIPSYPMDRCAHCRAWLGSAEVKTPVDTERRAYQHWLAKELKSLLLARPTLAPMLTGTECSRFLKSLLSAWQLSADSLSERVGVPVNSIRAWMRIRIKPKLSSWLRVCASLGASPAETLLDPILAAHQLPLPFPSAWIYVTTRPKPVLRHDGEAIRVALAAQLVKPTAESVKKFAALVEVPIGMLHYHAPAEVKELAALLSRRRAQRRKGRGRVVRKSGRRIIERWRQSGQAITRKAFALQLSKRTRCGSHMAKSVFSVLMQELDADDRHGDDHEQC